MSVAQLQKMQEKLLRLPLEEVEDFLLELASKIYHKKSQQKTLPPHIREGIKESLEEYERGEGTLLETDEDIDNYFDNLTKTTHVQN